MMVSTYSTLSSFGAGVNGQMSLGQGNRRSASLVKLPVNGQHGTVGDSGGKVRSG